MHTTLPTTTWYELCVLSVLLALYVPRCIKRIYNTVYSVCVLRVLLAPHVPLCITWIHRVCRVPVQRRIGLTRTSLYTMNTQCTTCACCASSWHHTYHFVLREFAVCLFSVLLALHTPRCITWTHSVCRVRVVYILRGLRAPRYTTWMSRVYNVYAVCVLLVACTWI